MSSTALTQLGALGAINQLFDKDNRTQALATVRESPGMALQVIADRSNALTLPARARAFDEVIGEIETPEQAQKLVAEYFHADHVNELLAARGGLPSAAVHTLDRMTLISAMLHDAETVGGSEEAMAMVVLAWAESMKDRSDATVTFLVQKWISKEQRKTRLESIQRLLRNIWFQKFI